MKIFTKEQLIADLIAISEQGWIKNTRIGNHGAIGNTLEDLLGIPENNLPIPNAAEWELKAQKIGNSSLTTLFHMEPSPTAIKFVPKILLLKYGWAHQSAGINYSLDELSFRQTISCNSASDRGFRVVCDRDNSKVLISFNSELVGNHHTEWFSSVKNKAGLNELDPQPYWGFDDLRSKAGTKLLNCFYVQAEVKKQDKNEYYKYSKILMLQKFSFDGF